jgi:trans-2,3-dihydro-3-hydroxyanthranilate isomerase
MQQIAREFNLSEIAFVERQPAAVEQAEGVRVRIFTTQEELNFAGHPTLGTASVLKLHAPETMRDDTVTLSLNVGAVPVRFSGEGLFGEMTQRDPEFGAELDPGEVARLTGLEADDLDPGLPPQIVSTGTAFAIVALRTAEALARLRVSQPEARPNTRPGGRPCAPLPRPDAVLRRRGPGHRLGGRLRHQLPGPARRGRARRAHPRAPGR